MHLSKIVVAVTVLAASAVWTGAAQAIPAFARKEQAACNACHTAWPMLNTVGRQYKENGYSFARGGGGNTEKISDFLEWDKHFPVTAVLVSRPYDKKDSGTTKNRALHEVELMVAGQLYRNVSGWFELEAEDEDDFAAGIKFGAVGYHPHKALNVQVAWAHLLWADPYDTYATTRLLTGPNRPQVINQSFGGADTPDGNQGRLRDQRQVLSVYGRPLNRLFYSVGYAGITNDTEGVEPSTYYGRLAFDVMPDTMAGLFAVKGSCAAIGVTRGNCLVDRDYRRSGMDFQIDVAGARVLAAYLKAEDDNAGATATVENDAWYAQGVYVFHENGRPTWVPLLRYDSYQKSNGTQEYKEAVLNLTYYFTQNIKGFVEYWKQLDIPAGQTEDQRLTLQFVAAF